MPHVTSVCLVIILPRPRPANLQEFFILHSRISCFSNRICSRRRVWSVCCQLDNSLRVVTTSRPVRAFQSSPGRDRALMEIINNPACAEHRGSMIKARFVTLKE